MAHQRRRRAALRGVALGRPRRESGGRRQDGQFRDQAAGTPVREEQHRGGALRLRRPLPARCRRRRVGRRPHRQRRLVLLRRQRRPDKGVGRPVRARPEEGAKVGHVRHGAAAAHRRPGAGRRNVTRGDGPPVAVTSLVCVCAAPRGGGGAAMFGGYGRGAILRYGPMKSETPRGPWCMLACRPPIFPKSLLGLPRPNVARGNSDFGRAEIGRLGRP